MRLVVTGTVGAGKSTFIRSVSEIAVVDTDRLSTDETAALKKKTTVAMDFGRLQFAPAMALHLYGTPGQSRFDFMWDILIRKAHAYIILVDAHRPSAFREARRLLAFMKQRVNIPMVIGLTHMDCEGAWSEENVAIALGFIDEQKRPPFVTLNANEKDSVIDTLIVLVEHYMKSLFFD
ncbi:MULTISPECIES: GTP-binding protein [unclassified Coleofasciculus]|uniref:GTP-binding protein n=1 Tax=unclassified Coleofasciculus TaxID=2692782 RepID=UPI001882F4B8|nr:MULTISPECIES: ATP/GTP-binding protein [unclassified Coleofasciculus]MBE9129152.1 ATP/GTP-binding protein [Coleofasciculus sp. LEGE 07081]MBE9151793.1 ATP/GTP-binding protein [Coleofasciculus sp. LEGE 07092]